MIHEVDITDMVKAMKLSTTEISAVAGPIEVEGKTMIIALVHPKLWEYYQMKSQSVMDPRSTWDGK